MKLKCHNHSIQSFEYHLINYYVNEIKLGSQVYNIGSRPLNVSGVKREAYRLTSHDLKFSFLKFKRFRKLPAQCSVTDSTVSDEITQFSTVESVPHDLIYLPVPQKIIFTQVSTVLDLRYKSPVVNSKNDHSQVYLLTNILALPQQFTRYENNSTCVCDRNDKADWFLCTYDHPKCFDFNRFFYRWNWRWFACRYFSSFPVLSQDKTRNRHGRWFCPCLTIIRQGLSINGRILISWMTLLLDSTH